MRNRRKFQRIIEFFTEITALVISNLLGILIFDVILHKIPDYELISWINYFLVLFVAYTIIFVLFASPINLLKRSKPMEIMASIRNSVLTFCCFGVFLIFTKNEITESRYLFFGVFFIYLFVSMLFRYFAKKFMIRMSSNSKLATQTGIISTCDKVDEFVSKLKFDWTKNIKAIALIDTRLENGSYKKRTLTYTENDGGIKVSYGSNINEIQGIPVVANEENLFGWIRTASLDEVYINLPEGMNEKVAEIIEELEDMGITVNVTIPSLEKIVEQSKFDNINCDIKAGYPMAVFSPAVHNERHLIVKRVFDIVGGLIGSIISLPIILITAIPLKLESPGPLIFKQQRVGKNGRVFNIYKLRSMYVDAEERKKALMEQNKMNGLMFKMDDDPRITKVGKFIRKYSIDELPQFWNVLKGDMSLVGTRPPTIDEFEQYESHHKRRLSLKPGITGIWQVSGRSDIQDFEEVVRLDCQYIDNWSLWLDIKILFKTVGVVLTHKGAE